MSTSFTYGNRKEGAVAPDALVRFVTEGELKAGAGGNGVIIQEKIDERLRSMYAKGLFQGRAEQAEAIATFGLIEAATVIAVGFVPGSGSDGLRLAAAAAARAVKSIRAKHVELSIHETALGGDIATLGASAAAQAITEGLILALHDRQPLKKETATRFHPAQVDYIAEAALTTGSSEEWLSGIARGRIVAGSVAYARDLTNLPGNDLTPERLAFHAEELAGELELDIEVIDEWTAAEQGMGALLGVGQGSVNPPRMIVLHYNGAPDSDEVWGLIGKGITFDTGGISLKRAPGMEEMISDMGGAAAVLGAVRAIAELKTEVNVVAVIPAAENMPSDRAFKPGDVLRTMSGYTVEVVNTDAEGRIVLADGLTTAIRRGATKLIDVATLTGAIMIALGYEATGALTNNEDLMAEVMEASRLAGERIWEMPAYPEFRKMLNSDAADLKNGGNKYGAASAAGLFIGHFAEGLPWVHLDIGGSAWIERARSWEPKGATGVMVRTLVALLERQV
ncbi:leucyl aminopeptidase [Paenibacillus sp. LHD-117]|uniref:leucyl aminopeptidase n=1 Tax=Paenibacillus sp. LHD-117 TaxID=3071412 RepID=UPI0027E10B1C|nr:leucyl aminopeptidase [Paenibacillus sp. LHD-117]MDQ6420386.1 leucyl aminopeptidase [Paenibacillus sp. LHD-117]